MYRARAVPVHTLFLFIFHHRDFFVFISMQISVFYNFIQVLVVQNKNIYSQVCERALCSMHAIFIVLTWALFIKIKKFTSVFHEDFFFEVIEGGNSIFFKSYFKNLNNFSILVSHTSSLSFLLSFDFIRFHRFFLPDVAY